jgi:hypothetical protein
MSGIAERPRRAGAVRALFTAVALPLLCTASGATGPAGSTGATAPYGVDAGRLVPPPALASGRGSRVSALPAVDIRRSGDPRNRITLVLLGDGFTPRQLGLFRAEADRAWRALMEIEPFRTYQHFFNIRRVEVASRVPGITEQRSPLRALPTPLGMHFWCDGTARLLCVDEQAAERLAGPVPGPHYVIAIANSVRYGGAGGAGVTTLAGGSPDAGRIIQHEMGHTLGGLGDEYDSAPGDADYPNLSSEDASSMLRHRSKWWRWLGAAAPDGSVVGAYRGANGLYRPTEDSVMRTLGRPYNPPAQEAVIESLYRQVDLVDAAGPTPGAVRGPRRLWVRPVPLVGERQPEIVWRVDGRPVRPGSADGTWLATAGLGLPRGRTVTVTATVRDTTDRVRDEAFRARWMTRTVRWTVRI